MTEDEYAPRPRYDVRDSPFTLSLSKNPLSLDGRGLGEGAPVHPEPVEEPPLPRWERVG